MQLKSVKNLLHRWQEASDKNKTVDTINIQLKQSDVCRIQAFSDIFNLDRNQIIQDIIHTSLDEIEASIPYIPGDKVIRIEDGDPIYEDIGLMPQYLKVRKQSM